MGRLESDQFAEPGVIVRVGQLRRILHVVQLVGAIDLSHEGSMAAGCRVSVERRGSLDEGRIYWRDLVPHACQDLVSR